MLIWYADVPATLTVLLLNPHPQAFKKQVDSIEFVYLRHASPHSVQPNPYDLEVVPHADIKVKRFTTKKCIGWHVKRCGILSQAIDVSHHAFWAIMERAFCPAPCCLLTHCRAINNMHNPCCLLNLCRACMITSP